MRPRLAICKTLLIAGFAILLATILLPNSQLFGGNVYPPSGGGGGSTPTPTATPTMTIPAAISTAGNVLTESNFTSAPSYTTHDMIACCIQQSSGSGKEFQENGWEFSKTAQSWNSGISWINLGLHCVQPTEPSTWTFAALTNDRSTGLACDVVRNTGCGQDVSGASNVASGTTMTYPSITTTVANDMLIYCEAAGVTSASTTFTFPGSVTSDVNSAGVSGTQAQFSIGHVLAGSPTAQPTPAGTLSSSQNYGALVGAIAPLH